MEEFIHYHQEVSSAAFDEHNNRWLAITQSGQQYQAQHLITAIGQLHKPFTPKLDQADTFKGEVFHSAAWNHSLDLAGKRAGVIGNAASAE